MQHGAEYIYESDDDNIPNKNLSLFLQSHPFRLIISTSNLSFNPYAHFGQSSIWPRGYPLDRVGMLHPHEYVMCPIQPPSIVQSLVDGDPDVDAIYRLTRRHSNVRLDIHFDATAPLYLNPSGTFSPFNSQNTLFHKRAFWGLLLPTTVTDRATDIFRSYWTQRLMWLAGQKLAFGPATFYQKRNDHNLLVDLEQEFMLYSKVGDFLKTLKSWKCSSKSFEECILELTRVVVDGGFWKEEDYDLVQAWIADLKDIDSSLLDQVVVDDDDDDDDGCRDNYKKHAVTFHAEEQMTSTNYRAGNVALPHLTRDDVISDVVRRQCGPSTLNTWKLLNNKSKLLPNVALVVSIFGDVESSLPAYEALYRLHFKKIVYCVDKEVPKKFSNEWKVTLINLKSGELSTVSCLMAARFMNLNVKGFLHLSDSMYFNVTSAWRGRPFQKPWLPKQESVSSSAVVSKTCSLRPNRCNKLTFKIFNEFSEKMTLPELSDKMKVKIEESVKKIRQVLSSRSGEATMLTDFPAYFPNSELSQLHLIWSSFNSNSWVSTEFMSHLVFNLYDKDAFRLRHANFSNPSSDFDYRSDIKIVTFLNNEFCKYF